MFRASTCPSSGGQIVYTQHLVSSLSVNGCTVHRLRADCRAVCSQLCIKVGKLNNSTRQIFRIFFFLIFYSNNDSTVFHNTFPPTPRCACVSFPKIEEYFKIVGDRKLTWNKFQTEDPQISGATVGSSVAGATWLPGMWITAPATDDGLNGFLVQVFCIPCW